MKKQLLKVFTKEQIKSVANIQLAHDLSKAICNSRGLHPSYKGDMDTLRHTILYLLEKEYKLSEVLQILNWSSAKDVFHNGEFYDPQTGDVTVLGHPNESEKYPSEDKSQESAEEEKVDVNSTDVVKEKSSDEKVTVEEEKKESAVEETIENEENTEEATEQNVSETSEFEDSSELKESAEMLTLDVEPLDNPTEKCDEKEEELTEVSTEAEDNQIEENLVSEETVKQEKTQTEDEEEPDFDEPEPSSEEEDNDQQLSEGSENQTTVAETVNQKDELPQEKLNHEDSNKALEQTSFEEFDFDNIDDEEDEINDDGADEIFNFSENDMKHLYDDLDL